jgi:hypothetical protein
MSILPAAFLTTVPAVFDFNDIQYQGRIQDIQKEGAGTVSAKTLILAGGKSMKHKWTITKKVMIL